MNILVIGGSGHVGTLVLPYLAREHSIRVLDKKPPVETSPRTEYVEGDLLDPGVLASALEDREVLLYMAMGPEARDRTDIAGAFDVNVKGVHLALLMAHRAGLQHAVYTSSMSVYQAVMGSPNETRQFLVDEDLPADARNLYGFTKRLGEEVCRNATRQWGISVNALRLCFPQSKEAWAAKARPDVPTMATEAEDVARALLAALLFRAGFQAFTISGDYEQKMMRMEKAKRLLGWEPLARPSPF